MKKTILYCLVIWCLFFYYFFVFDLWINTLLSRFFYFSFLFSVFCFLCLLVTHVDISNENIDEGRISAKQHCVFLILSISCMSNLPSTEQQVRFYTKLNGQNLSIIKALEFPFPPQFICSFFFLFLWLINVNPSSVILCLKVRKPLSL